MFNVFNKVKLYTTSITIIRFPFRMYADPKTHAQADPMMKLQFLVRHEVGSLAKALQVFIVSKNTCIHML